MHHDRRLDGFIDRLSKVGSSEQAHDVLCAHLREIGFAQSAFLALRRPDVDLVKPVILHTYDPAWSERYFAQDYARIDPVVATGAKTVSPFTWGGNRLRKTLKGARRTLMDEACDFGLAHGLTVPIHGVDGTLGFMSVALHESERKASAHLERFRHHLHLVGLYFFDHMGAHILSDGAGAHDILSPREKECLLWAGQGKTVWETSEILTISEHTVREYIANARTKLGVYSKSHAVVKAIALGLINPHL